MFASIRTADTYGIDGAVCVCRRRERDLSKLVPLNAEGDYAAIQLQFNVLRADGPKLEKVHVAVGASSN